MKRTVATSGFPRSANGDPDLESRRNGRQRNAECRNEQDSACTLMSVKAISGELCSVPYNMDDYPIDPPIAVVDTPKPRRLTTLAEARDFVDASMRLGRPPPWRDVYERLRSARSEDEAIEAIGALRELLQLEGMLVPPDLPLEPQHRE